MRLLKSVIYSVCNTVNCIAEVAWHFAFQQIKQVKERECGAGAVVSWETSPVLQVEVQAHKHRKDKSPEKKKKGKDVKSEKKSNKKSDGDAKKEDKDKKKEDKKKKEEEKEKKKQSKEENRVKLSEDVESGEKVRVKGDAALQYNDFVKHMKKVKKKPNLPSLLTVHIITCLFFQ